MLGIHADFIEVETMGRRREEPEDYVAVGHKHNGLLSINAMEKLQEDRHTPCITRYVNLTFYLSSSRLEKHFYFYPI